jgi:hypothetical protein
MDLVGMETARRLREMQFTVLHRAGGRWQPSEVSKFVSVLKAAVGGHPRHPEHLILFGHFTRDQVGRVLGTGASYSLENLVGFNNPDLPFTPALP